MPLDIGSDYRGKSVLLFLFIPPQPGSSFIDFGEMAYAHDINTRGIQRDADRDQ